MASSAVALVMARGAPVLATSPIGSARVAYGKPLDEFDYGQVTFGEGLHQAQFEHVHSVLQGLDNDSLLRPFRLAAGLPAPGHDLGGWYSHPNYGPETFGQWLSALSRYVAATGDAATREKVSRLVGEFARILDAGTIALNVNNAKYRTYFYDKMAIGLLDAHRYCHVGEALPCMRKLAVAAKPLLPDRAVDFFEPDRGAGESYTLPENQYLLWEASGERNYYQTAERYLDAAYFGPLAAGVDALPGRHAYSHVNALCSAAKAYLVTGDSGHLAAAVNGFRSVEAQSFATGGWGPGEAFVPLKPDAEQATGLRSLGLDPEGFASRGAAIERLTKHFETGCGSYAHFKLSRYLLRITKDPHYGDSMERVMYNCSLGILPMTRYGKTFYQSNYARYARKEYFDGYGGALEDEWPCCSGTIGQLAADYRVSAYFRDAAGVFVNLYMPSTLKWSQAGADFALEQAGDYPLADTVRLALRASKPKRFILRLRIPEWAVDPAIQINGRPLGRQVRAGTFAFIDRVWNDGDRVEIRLPMRLALVPIEPEQPQTVALANGPLILFAIGNDLPPMTRERLLGARQVAPAAAEWRVGETRFLPWWAIGKDVYTTYHTVG